MFAVERKNEGSRSGRAFVGSLHWKLLFVAGGLTNPVTRTYGMQRGSHFEADTHEASLKWARKSVMRSELSVA